MASQYETILNALQSRLLTSTLGLASATPTHRRPFIEELDSTTFPTAEIYDNGEEELKHNPRVVEVTTHPEIRCFFSAITYTALRTFIEDLKTLCDGYYPDTAIFFLINSVNIVTSPKHKQVEVDFQTTLKYKYNLSN